MPAGREVISVRITAETAAAIDAVRGAESRARWVGGLIDAALDHEVPTVTTESKGFTAPADSCTHPRARVIKGFCYRCGRMVNA